MDNLMMWGSNGLCSVDSSFGDISKETSKSIPTLRHSIGFSTFILSEPCSFHDSICRQDDTPARSCVVPKRYQPTHSFGCIPLDNCSCCQWVVVHRSPGPGGWRPKISRFFFPLPPQFLFFFPSILVFFVEFWWCLKRRGPEMCTFGVLWLTPTPQRPSSTGHQRASAIGEFCRDLLRI